MLTEDGPKVLEFNARFGDPETQAILPLLETDLLMIFKACVEQTLDHLAVQWSSKSAVCVVLASAGYPSTLSTGHAIKGLEIPVRNGMVFHAGTKLQNGQIVNAGGRVLGITCWEESLLQAIERTYFALTQISFSGMQYRQDIA